MRIFVQTKVCKMHVKVFDISVIRFFVIMGAESCKTLVIEISLDRVNSSDKDVESEIKLFTVQHKRIIDVPLNKEFMMES